MSAEPGKKIHREQLILDAVLTLLAQHGISGVSMRAVASEAGVSLGLVNYYYSDKISLMAAVLERVEKDDMSIVTPDPDKSAEENLRLALHQVNSPKFLTTDYVSLRLQLWALAPSHPSFEEINTRAQKRYRQGLSVLIRAARPELSLSDANKLATDIDIIQNGVWLTSLLGVGRPAVKRATELCETIAFS
ncbi:AcrR family transcriptional regulator [Paeniglutamicibacter cryotolerans]|uniref:AcrR family transcriptional regulator n=2 Tax=Paeniglutamicibacter cryotolerans TaxID=670079 RepID=A0A839QM89_9MICC|nr:AcrR family transcriptional regulator [Paeniglutamicibacter cryotolerans]